MYTNHCHRVFTQLQLTNISISIYISASLYQPQAPPLPPRIHTGNIPEFLILGLKLQAFENDHLTQSSVDIKNVRISRIPFSISINKKFYGVCTVLCNIIVYFKPKNAPLFKQYFNLCDNFYMFQTRGSFFRKAFVRADGV
jgi:hypothetical protein